MPAVCLLPCVAGIDAAATALRAGACVAFPTETVYGLGANALSEDAVLNIFKFKGRPLTDPLIVHVPSAAAAEALLTLDAEGRELFHLLAANFWPGPLTIVAKAAACIPLKVTAGTGFVGVRVPAHPVAHRLLEVAGIPVAAPSANRFGHVSPTRAEHVLVDLGHCPISILLDEGEELVDGVPKVASTADSAGAGAKVGIESSVIKIDTLTTPGLPRLVVFRRGFISQQAVRALLDSHGFAGVDIVYHSLHKPLPTVAQQEALPNDSAPPAVGSAATDAAHARVEARAAEDADAVGDVRSPSAGTPIAVGHEAETSKEAGEVVGMEAPGMLLTHYSPDVCTKLLTAFTDAPASACSDSGNSSSVVGSAGSTLPIHLAATVLIDVGGRASAWAGRVLAYRDISPTGSLLAACQQLFDALRWTETQPGAKLVLLVDPHLVLSGEGTTVAPATHSDLVDALFDRMFRAASGVRVSLPSTIPAPGVDCIAATEYAAPAS